MHVNVYVYVYIDMHTVTCTYVNMSMYMYFHIDICHIWVCVGKCVDTYVYRLCRLARLGVPSTARPLQAS